MPMVTPSATQSTREARARPAAGPMFVAGLLALWGAFLIVSASARLGPTVDEPSHLGCGLQLLDQGVYTYERLHPPLARVAAAFGPFLDGHRFSGAPNPIEEGRRQLYQGEDRQRTLRLARVGALPFFLLGAVAVFLGTRWLWEPWTAAVAVGLYVHLPPILAHGGLATTDMAGSATLALAFVALGAWFHRPSRSRALAMGLAVGAAWSTKYSALPFLACFAALITAARLVGEPAWRLRSLRMAARWKEIGLAVGVALGVLFAAHGFGVEPLVGDRERPYRNVDRWVGEAGPVHDLVYAAIELPVVPVIFRSVRDGLHAAMEKNRQGHTGFLLGEMAGDGWWAFFPVAIAVKSPIPFLLLALGGLILVSRRAFGGPDWLALLPLAAIAAVLMPSLPSRINIGLRHVLAIYPFLAILAAVAVVWLVRPADGETGPGKKLVARSCGVALVLWQVVAVVAAHPDYLPWFNASASSAPERVLNDSDLDWGQDIDRLADELRARGVSELWLAYFGSALPEHHGLPAFRKLPQGRPVSGWVAISLFEARGLYLEKGPAGPYAWLATHRPVTRVGGSIDLYFIADSSL